MSKIISYSVQKNNKDTQYDWNEEYWLTFTTDNGMMFIRREPFAFKNNAENCGHENVNKNTDKVICRLLYGVAYVPVNLRENFDGFNVNPNSIQL